MLGIEHVDIVEVDRILSGASDPSVRRFWTYFNLLDLMMSRLVRYCVVYVEIKQRLVFDTNVPL